MNGAFRNVVGIARRLARFAREVDRGIAVGRGCAPVGQKVAEARRAGLVRRGAGCARRASRGRVRTHRSRRRGGGGRP